MAFGNTFSGHVKSLLLHFWPPGWNQREVHVNLSLGLTNSLGGLTELRKLVYSLKYQFIIRDYNSGAARGQRCTEQAQGKLWAAAPSLVSTPPGHLIHLPGSPPSPTLSGFMEASLHLAVSDPFSLWPPTSPWNSGFGTENPNPLIVLQVPQTSKLPSWGAFQKSPC